MCLAVPGEILEIKVDDSVLPTARVRFGAIVKEVNLAFTPEARVGDYVLVHVGFALSIINEKAANQVFEYLEQLEEADPEGRQQSGEAPRSQFTPPPSAGRG